MRVCRSLVRRCTASQQLPSTLVIESLLRASESEGDSFPSTSRP